MTTLLDDPLYQELLNKGYVPGFNPNTGAADIVYLLNVANKNQQVDTTKAVVLSTLEGGINNNPSEKITVTEAGNKYSTTLTKNQQPMQADRIAFGLGQSPEDRDFCYGMDLNFTTQNPSLRISLIGIDPEGQYGGQNYYALAQSGIFINGGLTYNKDDVTDAVTIYNLDPTSTKNFQIKGLTPYKPTLASYDVVGIEPFGNDTLEHITDAYTFELAPQINPLTTNMNTRTTRLEDYRWTDGEEGGFDGYTFGFAFKINSNPQVYFETVDITHNELMVARTTKVFNTLMIALANKYSGVAELKTIFNYSEAQSYAFAVSEEVFDSGPSFFFDGLRPDGGIPSGIDVKVIIDPDYPFPRERGFINIGRDYRLGDTIPVSGAFEHGAYPIFSQNRYVVEGV